MRYLRKQVLNRRSPFDQRLSVDINDAIVMKTTSNVTLPSGTTAQRPVSPVNGMLRYNTDIVAGGEMEIYQSNTWRSLRFKESTQIVQQNLGAGDSINVYFGPLNPAPPVTTQSNTTWGAQNLLVVVENVIQLSNTNYTIVQNPTTASEVYVGTNSVDSSIDSTVIYFNTHLIANGASGNGTVVTLTFIENTQVPFSVGSSIIVTGFSPYGYNGTYVVTASTNTSVSFLSDIISTMVTAGNIKSSNVIYPSVDITGAVVTDSSFQPNTVIVSYVIDPITDALISITIDKPTITAIISANTAITIAETSHSNTGYYLMFSSPVPVGKPVTVLHGFDR